MSITDRWHCLECGHEWGYAPFQMRASTACPNCESTNIEAVETHLPETRTRAHVSVEIDVEMPADGLLYPFVSAALCDLATHNNEHEGPKAVEFVTTTDNIRVAVSMKAEVGDA